MVFLFVEETGVPRENHRPDKLDQIMLSRVHILLEVSLGAIDLWSLSYAMVVGFTTTYAIRQCLSPIM